MNPNGVKTKKSPTPSTNRLWWHRKKMGYSQKVVATLIGHKTTAHISAYEGGTRLPSLETALKLERILCVPVAFLFPNLYTPIKGEIDQRQKALAKPDRNA